MELLFVVLGGALIGGVVRYILPRRSSYGAALLPAIGAVVAAIAWAVLTWAGWRFDGGWIWAVSLVLATGASVATGLWLPRRRARSDARLLARMSRAGV